MVYTPLMPDRAKLFKSGGSQAVRLPKGYRFEGQEEVLIFRKGPRVILEPVHHSWSREFLDLAGSAPDFPYPEEPLPADPGPDFD
jgi:antitoxin VapB